MGPFRHFAYAASLATLVVACAKVLPPEPVTADADPTASAVDPAAGTPDGAAAEASGTAPSDPPPASGPTGAAPTTQATQPAASGSVAPSATASSATAPKSSASAVATSTASPATPPKAVDVSVEDPKFTSGEVPKAKAALEKLRAKVEQCVVDHGGLSGDSGEIVVQFLVRLGGIAEGVDVLRAKGVSPDAKTCVRDLVKKRSVGAPTSDPTGVEVTFTVAPRK